MDKGLQHSAAGPSPSSLLSQPRASGPPFQVVLVQGMAFEGTSPRAKIGQGSLSSMSLRQPASQPLSWKTGYQLCPHPTVGVGLLGLMHENTQP